MADEIHVLYVDDESDLLEIGKQFLEENGEFTVDTALSAQEALAILKEKTYDAIVSDYQMPKMDGVVFLKKVRSADKNIPFIMFTGRSREEVVIEALNNGANFFLQKGGAPEALYAELIHVIRQSVQMRRAQMTIAEQEQRYHDLQNANDLIQSVTPDGHIHFVNKKWLDTLGYQEQDLANLTLFDVIDEGSLAHCRETFRQVISGENVGIIDAVFRARDGSKVYVEGMASCRMVEGQPQYTRGIFKDVTDRRKAEFELLSKNEELNAAFGQLTATEEELRHNYNLLSQKEQALRESEEKFRTIFENSPYPAAINSLPDNKFLEVNAAFLNVSGYTEEEILGKDPVGMGLLPVTEVVRLVSRRILEGKIENVPLALTAKAGKRIHVVFSTIPITISNKPAIMTVTAEVTHLKRVEEELLRKNENLNAAYEELAAANEEFRQNYEELGKNQQVLRASEEKFRALVELSLEGIIITDFTGKLLFANQEAGRIFDAPDYEKMIGKRNVMEFVAPESRAAVLKDFAKVALGIDAYLVHYRLITETKREIWGEVIGKKIPFADSSAILISIRDVTERKQADELLRESENKFATIFRSSPVVLTLVSATDGKFVDVNDVFVRSTGYSRDEVIGNTSEAVGIFADPGERERLYSTLRDQRYVSGMDVQCRIKTGEIHTCRFSSGLILMGGKPHILSTIENATERRKAEAALRESEEKFRSLVENANDIVFSMTPDGVFTYVSPKWTELLGHDTRELIGKKASAFIHPDDLPRCREFLRQTIMKGEKLSGIEYRIQHKNGSWQWHAQSGAPLRDASGTIVAYLGICHDISERKQAEDALRQANKKLNLLSSITRHDIRNQLMTLDGFVELLRRKNPDPAFETYLSRIKSASSQITNMIKFTKEYEKIGVNAPVWQDLRALVDSAGRSVTLGPVTLKNDLPATMEVFADPLIAKVFFNLIDNAVRHGGKLTTIRFSTELRKRNRIIICEDDGDGVAGGEKEQIFNRGFGKNTGFGLAISRDILDITGITIQETGEAGKGARFEITVPEEQFRVSNR